MSHSESQRHHGSAQAGPLRREDDAVALQRGVRSGVDVAGIAPVATAFTKAFMTW